MASPIVNNEKGIVLVSCLMLLLILTMVGITTMQTTTLQERMSGSIADKDLAFQAAEAALRDAELEIESEVRFINSYTGPPTDPSELRRVTALLDGPFTAACSDGLCFNSTAAAADTWTTTKVGLLRGGAGTGYGSQTGLAALPRVAAQPRYLIDFQCQTVAGASFCTYVFTITALGIGARADSQVLLEEAYRLE